MLAEHARCFVRAAGSDRMRCRTDRSSWRPGASLGPDRAQALAFESSTTRAATRSASAERSTLARSGTLLASVEKTPSCRAADDLRALLVAWSPGAGRPPTSSTAATSLRA
ncbi:hypothetical protein BE20_39375 [Sorangium cellulosum]|uniref:Uncharacterized protein n=1 Tax=Sorangium cellulosum TaxID=56 RepID=A0A150SXK0_SORCE|nr:hypothetical protein BE18_10215 [Sorangium cellulosum]KYF97245.1 hypothetical protein BE20_39375 [Sorangium cellulosum]